MHGGQYSVNQTGCESKHKTNKQKQQLQCSRNYSWSRKIVREAYVLDHLEEFFSHFLFPFCPVPTWWKQRPHPCQGLGSLSLTLTCTGMDRERGGPESMAWLGPLFPPPGIRSSMQTWSAKIEFFNNVVNVSLPKKSKALLSLKWLGILKKERKKGKNKCVTLFYGIFKFSRWLKNKILLSHV